MGWVYLTNPTKSEHKIMGWVGFTGYIGFQKNEFEEYELGIGLGLIEPE